jgi:hypothetical protein
MGADGGGTGAIPLLDGVALGILANVTVLAVGGVLAAGRPGAALGSAAGAGAARAAAGIVLRLLVLEETRLDVAVNWRSTLAIPFSDSVAVRVAVH